MFHETLRDVAKRHRFTYPHLKWRSRTLVGQNRGAFESWNIQKLLSPFSYSPAHNVTMHRYYHNAWVPPTHSVENRAASLVFEEKNECLHNAIAHSNWMCKILM